MLVFLRATSTGTGGVVDVAGAQGTPFQIAELVEQEQGMVAGASEVSVVGRALLLAVCRAKTILITVLALLAVLVIAEIVVVQTLDC